MKVCIDCQIEKPLNEFEFRKDTQKHRSQCNICYKAKKSISRKKRYYETNEYNPEARRAYYEAHKEHDKIRNAEYYQNNKEKINARCMADYYENKDARLSKAKEYRDNNQEKEQARHEKYREENREIINEKARIYRQHNPDKIKATRHKHYTCPENKQKRRNYDNAYVKHKRKTDPVFVLKERFKNRTRKAFKEKLGEKAVKSITELLGCSPEFFKQYFESKFTEGMTWEKVYSGEIEIDHIVPISIGYTEEQLKILSHYTNLRPMWKQENQEKSDSIIEGVQLPFDLN